MRKARINPSDAPEIQKQLSFAKTLSSEIRKAGKEKKNSKQNIRSVISGKILRKYKLIHYTARRTNTDPKKTIRRNKQGDKPQQIKERMRAKSLQSRD